MADHPLRPATDRRLGGPLPHQLANRTSAAPIARGPCRSPAFTLRSYAVLANLSTRYPPRRGTFRCVTHPFAARRQGCPRAAARLACVKHSASVQSEPGSNSSVKSFQTQNGSPRSSLHLPTKTRTSLLPYEHSFLAPAGDQPSRATKPKPLSSDPAPTRPQFDPVSNPHTSASNKYPHLSAV